MCSCAYSPSSRPVQPSPDAGMPAISRRAAATPGACASTMRAAIGSMWRYPPLAPDRPARTWSRSQMSSSARPAATRARRCPARRAAASSLSAVGAGLAAAVARPTRSARSARLAIQDSAKPGGWAASGTRPSAQLSNSATACLHGNFRDGQEHLYAGPDTSAITWYGCLPDPAHSPHTTSPAAPACAHGAGPASFTAACRDDASGASAMTRSALQRVDMRAPYPGPPTNRAYRLDAPGRPPFPHLHDHGTFASPAAANVPRSWKTGRRPGRSGTRSSGVPASDTRRKPSAISLRNGYRRVTALFIVLSYAAS